MLFPDVTSATAANDHDCSSSTQPTIVKYSASPTYQIVGLSRDCKTSDTASSLNTSSNLVKALGGGASGCRAGLSAVGDVATFYADVITAAQTALTTNGRTGVQKGIIFLSGWRRERKRQPCADWEGFQSMSRGDHCRGGRDGRRHQGLFAAQ